MNHKEHWLAAPATIIDPQIKDLIREKWDDPEPTAIQILEVLDHVVHWGAGADIAVLLLDLCLQVALIREGKELEDLFPLATWRNE